MLDMFEERFGKQADIERALDGGLGLRPEVLEQLVAIGERRGVQQDRGSIQQLRAAAGESQSRHQTVHRAQSAAHRNLPAIVGRSVMIFDPPYNRTPRGTHREARGHHVGGVLGAHREARHYGADIALIAVAAIGVAASAYGTYAASEAAADARTYNKRVAVN
jgi:hypothetical protein